jgi:hypothetical protein
MKANSRLCICMSSSAAGSTRQKKVHAEKASTTVFALYEVKHHLMVMAAAVDWRLNRATADRFLRAFIGNADGTGERDEADRIYEAEEENCGRLVTASEWKTVRGWASYFCHLGVLHNLTYLHGESVLASACIFAGHWKLNICPLSTAHLQELYGIGRRGEKGVHAHADNVHRVQ